VLAAKEFIKLEDFVQCGANVLITDFDWHEVEPNRRREGSGEPLQVVIERNVWLGVNTIVLKGVRIGKNTVIGANSLVTRDIPENVVAGGNPCQVIKKLST
jgi:acetyltransferase-like isoleucine patch superfamily enzyme